MIWLAKTAGYTYSELVFGKPIEEFGKLLETELTEMVLSKMVHAATNAGNPADTAINEVSELVEYIRRDSNPQPSVPKTDALSS